MVANSELTEHDVRVKYYGCTGAWAIYTCYTCHAIIDTGRDPFFKGWREKKAEFLKNHPHKEVKDETQYKVIDYDDM